MNILLMYGGNSCEHDISIITAGLAKRHFAGRLYCCYMDTNNDMWLVDSWLSATSHKNTKHTKRVLIHTNSRGITVVGKRRKHFVPIHCAVNCCHGGVGEGGALSGLLKLANIPVVGSNSTACGIAMDKIHTKHILNGANLPTIEGVELVAGDYTSNSYIDIVASLGYPVIVKPATLGSSIGIGVAHNSTELSNSLEVAFGYDNRVLVERWCEGCSEYNCSVMRACGSVQTSSIDTPLGSSEILSFADKYLSSGKMTYNNKADIDPPLAEAIASMSRQVYNLLDMSGVVRIDYIYYNNTLYINEINTVPGSLAYGLWQDKYTAKQFGTLLVEQAIADHTMQQTITSSYASCVLDTTKLTNKLGKKH